MSKSNGSIKRSVVAGAIGGIVAVAVAAILAAVLLRRIGQRLMPRMMADGSCSEQMRACMEKCGCGRPETADGADRS